MKRLLVSALVAFGTLTGPAQASDIVVQHIVPTCTGGDECRYFMEQPYDNYRLVASPGERNRITVRAAGSGTRSITFRDDGAPIRDAGGCERLAENEVRCRGVGASTDAGDMDDTVFVEGDVVFAAGGTGNDELTGGEGQESLSGDLGSDVVRGGGNGDTLYDQPGAAGDADLYDAGPGGGQVDYSGSTTPVVVDLSAPTADAGEAGEGDRLANVTGVVGGRDEDRLTAGPEGSSLQGREGEDLLIGGPGPDFLYGGSGRNVLDAGAGDDTIVDGATASQQQVACGEGSDEVAQPDASDLLGADCERAEMLGGAIVTSLLPLRSLRSPVVKAGGFECFGRGLPKIELRVARAHRRAGMPRAGTLLGRRTATRRACRASRPASVRLSARGQRLLRSYRRLAVEVRLRDPGGDGPEGYVVDLTAP